jgi:predicted enzyme related to lactoylglutathione lyase
MQIGIYVAVSNLERGKVFYSALFDCAPYLENANFIGFRIGGVKFGLIRADAYAFPMTRGNNAIPNITVEDIEEAHAHVKSIGPSKIQEHIAQVGPTRLFMFMDPDGNVIEFSSTTE